MPAVTQSLMTGVYLFFPRNSGVGLLLALSTCHWWAWASPGVAVPVPDGLGINEVSGRVESWFSLNISQILQEINHLGLEATFSRALKWQLQFVKGGKRIQSVISKEEDAGCTRASWETGKPKWDTVIQVRLTPTSRHLTYITTLFARMWGPEDFLEICFICKELDYYFD